MCPKKFEGENPEIHTLRELCTNMFELMFEIAEFYNLPITQERLDKLPQMVRLVNEDKISKLGLNSRIDSAFREQVLQNKSLDVVLEEGVYYRALEGMELPHF